jgi:glutamyl-Q tRNA(Asp) synthetase
MHNKAQPYIGRFAPSPTGQVHFGTLLAAVGSYLQAKENNGKWLIRMEDVDTTRKVSGADKDILDTLEAFGFNWDGDVLYQSSQTEHYQQALQQLRASSLLYPCLCSRKQLTKSSNDIYPGNCQTRTFPEAQDHAVRLRAKEINIAFDDAVMGLQKQDIKTQCGDFIIKRRDGLFAYQLAVVVDDALQGITEIVRGSDLLDSTPRQIYLQKLLGYTTPTYCHLPLAVDKQGNKISKSEAGTKVNIKDKERLLCNVLEFLGQQPPLDLADSNIDDIWSWAITHWSLTNIPSKTHIQLVLSQK